MPLIEESPITSQTDVAREKKLSNGSKQPESAKPLTARLKSYAWRITAAYIWLKAIAAFSGWYPTLAHAETDILGHLISFLSSIGFAPVNTAPLSAVMKICWLLLITGFSFFELVFFLLVYILTMPGWLPLYLILTRFSGQEIAVAATEGKSENRSRFRLVFPAVTSLFVAWFLLYGNATTKAQLVPGAVLSGLFFLVLIYRLLLKTTPMEGAAVPILTWLSVLISVANRQTHERVKKNYKKKSDVQYDQRVSHLTRKVLTKLTLLMKEPTTPSRISLYVLGEYITSLIIVAVAAILFWTIVIKALVSPETSLIDCFQISASHFLPGIQSITQVQLPLWSRLGPAATAWVLFVLYLGPASSLLPQRQSATLDVMTKTLNVYKASLRTLGKEKQSLRKAMKALES